MAKTWKKSRAEERIDKRLKEVAKPEIVDYKRDLSLENIPTNKAYRTNGAHLYADIVNLEDMLHCTSTEGETCHRRTLRFLNLHFRAVDRILSESDAKRVDFANQRLHAIVLKPYDTEDGAEVARVHRAVAIAQLIIDVLAETGDSDNHIPDAQVRVGIDTGKALAVNNGRSGGRESLFLGRPANQAAKRAAADKATGIFLTNEARQAIGLKTLAKANIDTTPLTAKEIAVSQEKAKLTVTKDEIVKLWRKDLEANPIGSFEFRRHTPPLSTLKIADLTPGNSRRQEAVSIYADLDGFSRFVESRIDEKAEDVVKTLHVIRSEVDSVVTSDFSGRKIRFIGDCEHALSADGTAHTTDGEVTVSNAVLCAGAIRSSLALCLEKLEDDGVDVTGLGIAIGVEYGPMTVTRLGLRGNRVRCSISRGVITSEHEQQRCNGRQSAIGPVAYATGTDAVRALFGEDRIADDLDYDDAVEQLDYGGDSTAKQVREDAEQLFTPAIAAAPAVAFRPHAQAIEDTGDSSVTLKKPRT